MTHYETLGVAPDVDGKTIQKAYRKHARALHPDTNPDPLAREQLAKISDSYAVLSDPTRRASYDRTLGIASAPVPRAAAAPPDPTAAAAGTRQEGRDLFVEVTAAPAEIDAGFTRDVAVSYTAACPSCDGTGFAAVGAARECLPCQGLGMHPVTGSGCDACAGRGHVYDSPCGSCGGSRATRVETTVSLVFARGAQGRIRFPRRGAVSGSSRGDLYATLTPNGPAPSAAATPTPPPVAGTPPAPSPPAAPAAPAASGAGAAGAPVFLTAANGADLGLVLELRYTELRLGGRLPVPLPDGTRTTLAVPANTRPGTVLVVTGAGNPRPDGRRGDLHVRLDLHWPANPAGTDEHVALAALATTEEQAPRPSW